MLPPEASMTPERWERVKTLYDAARLRPARDRSAFLARECVGDTDLQLEIESLLDQPVGTADFVSFVGGAATLPAGQPAESGARCSSAAGSAPSRCSRCSAAAAWARSIGRMTPSSVATSR
jgi:hypothetical protein